MIERVRVKLSDIRPSDLPREESWQARQAISPPAEQPINLDTYGIKIIRAGEDWTVQDGNHLLARLVQVFGEDHEVEAEIDEIGSNREKQWAQQLQWVSQDGVSSFKDYLGKILKGEFYR